MNNLNKLETKLSNETRIILFLRGEMTSEEEKHFLEIVKTNPELKADAINIARLAKGIKQVGEEKDLLLKKSFLASEKRFINKEDITKEPLLEFANYELSESDVDRMNNANDKIYSNNIDIEKTTKKSYWLYFVICLFITFFIIAIIFCCMNH